MNIDPQDSNILINLNPLSTSKERTGSLSFPLMTFSANSSGDNLIACSRRFVSYHSA